MAKLAKTTPAAGTHRGARLRRAPSAAQPSVAEVLQAMAAEAGFDLKIRVTEFATSLTEAEQGRFQAFLIGWSGRIDPDGNSYVFLKCGAPQNNGHYCDRDVDGWLEDARKVSKFEERKALYGKIAEKSLKDGSIIYLYHRLVI